MSNGSKLVLEDRKYELTRMHPIKAVPFGMRVAKLFSGALGAGLAQGMDQDKMLDVLTNAAQKLDPDDCSKLIMDALAYEVWATTNDGKKTGKLDNQVYFNDWFKLYPGDMYPVGIWAIWEHSKDFLFGSAGTFRKVVGNLGPALTSPKSGEKPTSSED